MTFLELCQRLRQEVGAAGTGPASVTGQSGENARLIDWVRTAWREIQADRRQWRFAWAEASIAVTTSSREYALPADFDCWDQDTLCLDDKPLSVQPWGDFRSSFREPKGSVKIVSISPDDVIHLNALPGQAGALTFEYWRTPQELTNNSDVPRLPERYHMAIVYRAFMQYGFYENAPEVIQQSRINYGNMIADMEVSQLPVMELEGKWMSSGIRGGSWL